MKNSIPFLLLLLLMFFLSGCDKDDDPDPEPTAQDLLVAGVWQGDQLRIDGVDVSPLPLIKDELLDMSTLRITFNRDKTYLATFRRGADPVEERGNWELKHNDQILELDFLGDTEVLRLTAQQLNLAATLSDTNNDTFDAEIRLIR